MPPCPHVDLILAARRPPRPPGLHALAANARPAFGIELSARRTGDRPDRDFSTWPATPVTLPAYTVVDLAAEIEVARARARWPGFAVTVRAENLAGAEYEEVWGFAAPGRGLYVGGRVVVGGGG